jgi:hypothetical protein
MVYGMSSTMSHTSQSRPREPAVNSTAAPGTSSDLMWAPMLKMNDAG